MSYSVANLKKLRSLTEVAIKECIKALDANNDDLSKALAWLKERSSFSSKSSRLEPSERSNKLGIVRISNSRNKIVAFSLKCESDFVAMNSVFTKLADDIAVLLVEKFTRLANYSREQLNEELRTLVNDTSYSLNEKIYVEKISFFTKEESEVFGQYVHHNAKVGAFVIVDKGSAKVARELSMQAVANTPIFLARENIPHEMLSAKLGEIKRLVTDESSSRESVITERIVNGRLSKWVSEVCFLEQNDFRDPARKIRQILHNADVNIRRLFLINIDN